MNASKPNIVLIMADRYLNKELSPLAQGSWSESIVPETRTIESPVPTAEEQYFNLHEVQNNLYEKSSSAMDRVEYLRSKLIDELKGREEEYVKDGKLIVGKTS